MDAPHAQLANPDLTCTVHVVSDNPVVILVSDWEWEHDLMAHQTQIRLASFNLDVNRTIAVLVNVVS